jgi:hypothetical protein
MIYRPLTAHHDRSALTYSQCQLDTSPNARRRDLKTSSLVSSPPATFSTIMASSTRTGTFQCVRQTTPRPSVSVHVRTACETYTDFVPRGLVGMPCNMPPALVSSPEDLVEYKVDTAEEVEKNAKLGYLERHIHSEIYKR